MRWPVTSRPRSSRRVNALRSGRSKIVLGMSRSFGWTVSEPPSSEDLDPYPATTRPTPPTTPTPSIMKSPIRGHCTRTEEVHCLRIGCSAPIHKNKRGTDRAHLLPATTSPGASGGLIVPHGHCPTASVVQVARSDSCCTLLILTPTATPQKPKPPPYAQGRQNSLSSQQATAPPHHRGQPHPGSKPEASRGRAPRLLAGTTRPPRCTPWRPDAHTRSQ